MSNSTKLTSAMKVWAKKNSFDDRIDYIMNRDDSIVDICPRCDETVGDDYCNIMSQLKNAEPICMWCGDKFDEVEKLEEDWSQRDDDDLAQLNSRSRKYFMSVENIASKSKNKVKRTISPKGSINSDGTPRDRVQDASPYQRIPRNGIAHRILKYVADNPGCRESDVYKNVWRAAMDQKKETLSNRPLSNVCANGFLTYNSRFIGYQKIPVDDHRITNPDDLGRIPRFTRKYTITNSGMLVIDEFNTGTKKVIMV